MSEPANIEHVWAIIGKREETGEERIACLPGSQTPMLSTDEADSKLMVRAARAVSRLTKTPYRLVRFDTRVDLGPIETTIEAGETELSPRALALLELLSKLVERA